MEASHHTALPQPVLFLWWGHSALGHVLLFYSSLLSFFRFPVVSSYYALLRSFHSQLDPDQTTSKNASSVSFFVLFQGLFSTFSHLNTAYNLYNNYYEF